MAEPTQAAPDPTGAGRLGGSPWTRRRLLRAAVLGTAAVAVPAGCGVPSGGPPIVDGAGPSFGPGAADGNGKAPVPQDANSPEALIRKYLGAVSGRVENDADLTKAQERATEFLTTNARQGWQAGNQITVVRLLSGPNRSAGDRPGATFVDVTLEPVGVMQTNGTVGAPAGSTAAKSVRFTVVPNDDPDRSGGLLIDAIDGPPQFAGMLLDSAGLDDMWYHPQLIYFWDTGRRGLVPDLRYVPRVGLTVDAQRTEIVNWVLAGPSDLLSDAVVANMYNQITLLGPNLVAPQNDRLLINLSAAPQGTPPTDVIDQMRASLGVFYQGSVLLEFASQAQQADGDGDRYQARNLADQNFRSPDATEFAITSTDRSVHEVATGEVPPALSGLEKLNKDVVYAALTRDQKTAALVRADHRLYLVGGARRGGPPGDQPVAGLSGTGWTRPVWLSTPVPRVLVAVDGALRVVAMDGKTSDVTPGGVGSVTAFSVAPDNHRIALIADGRAWVGALRADSDGMSIGPLRGIDPMLSDLSGVAWSRLARVVVAGRSEANHNYQLCEITIDGAIAIPWDQGAYSAPITQVVGYPNLPSQSMERPGSVLVQTETGTAYRATPYGFEPLAFSRGWPSPSPSATSSGQTTPVPRNPFYLD